MAWTEPWRIVRAVCGGALLGVAGCASTCDPDTQPAVAVGELGNGDFLYSCELDSDPSCAGGSMNVIPGCKDIKPSGCNPAPTFPDCIVRGGLFRLGYRLRDESALSDDVGTPYIRIESASPQFFTGTDGLWAHRTGRAAVLAREEEYVIDMLHLTIVEPTSMRLTDDAGAAVTTVEVAVGETAIVYARPFTEQCIRLGGGMPVDAFAADPDIVATSGLGAAWLTGSKVGTTTVDVHMGPFTAQVTVVVTEGVTAGTDTGSETGIDTDTDTDASGTATDTDPSSTGTGPGSSTDTDTDTDTASSTSGTGGSTTGTRG